VTSGAAPSSPPHKLTLGEWLETWLKDYKAPSIRPSTLDSYAMMIRVYLKPALGHIALKDLRPNQVQRVYNEKRDAGLSSRTVRYLHTILHGVLKQAMKDQLVIRNVGDATTPPVRKTRKMRLLTRAQVHQFLVAVKEDRLFPAIFPALGTGVPHIRFHDGCHTFAALMLELGEAPKTVQTMLGHTKIATALDIYSRVSLDLEKRALARLG
jgi:integrase